MDKLPLVVRKTFSLLREKPSYYYLLFAFIILAISTSYRLKSRRQRYAAAPIACIEDGPLEAARGRFKFDARRMLREGYEKFKGRPFYVPSPLGERLMIPSKYVDELKVAPVNEVDFVGTFFEVC